MHIIFINTNKIDCFLLTRTKDGGSLFANVWCWRFVMKKSILVFTFILVFAVSLFAAGSQEKQGNAYPSSSITMIVPYGAGGTTDLMGRQFALGLQKVLGKSITVVNQGGASGSIGCKAALDAAPDGYTILFTAESLGTQRVMGISKMSYADFAPIMAVSNDPKVIVVGKDSKYKTLEELLSGIKASPNKVKMSYTGPGGSGHVQGLIMKNLGYEAAMTAYGSGADCILAVLSKQVDFTNSNYSTVVGYLASGDLKLLGVASSSRLAPYPEVPTLIDADASFGPYLNNPFTPLSLLVSKDVSPEIQSVLREASLKVVADPDFKKYVADNCIEPLYEKYKTIDEIKKFYVEWESLVSWLLADAGATKYSPSDFGIERLK